MIVSFLSSFPRFLVSSARYLMVKTPQIFQMQWFARMTLPVTAYSTIAGLLNSSHHKKQSAKLKKVCQGTRAVCNGRGISSTGLC